jgi:hypothetical protein
MSFVADIAGALIGADASRKASNTQADSTRAAIGEQARQYDLAREDLAPYRQTGVNALQMLARANGLDGGTMGAEEVMRGDPGYQFRLQQGQQALDRRFAAQGGRFSGSSLKAASDYNQGMAAQGFSDRMNRLSALAGIGQTSTSTTAGLGANAANQISGLISSQGDATAAARLNQGNIWGNAINSIGAQYKRGGGFGGGGGFGSFGDASYGGDASFANDVSFMGG